MRQLMKTMILAVMIATTGCTAIQPFQTTQAQLQPIDNTEVLLELSYMAKLELYVMNNETQIRSAMDLMNIPVPEIVFAASAEDKKQISCLARNIYWEASGEPVRGKAAVAQVTINRTADERFADDICGVVFERDRVKVRGRMRTVCQFSWTCMSVKTKTPKNNEQWEEAVQIAQKFVLDGSNLPELEEALFYHAKYVKPRWAKQMIRIERIGNHIFYREKERQTAIYLASN